MGVNKLNIYCESTTHSLFIVLCVYFLSTVLQLRVLSALLHSVPLHSIWSLVVSTFPLPLRSGLLFRDDKSICHLRTSYSTHYEMIMLIYFPLSSRFLFPERFNRMREEGKKRIAIHQGTFPHIHDNSRPSVSQSTILLIAFKSSRRLKSLQRQLRVLKSLFRMTQRENIVNYCKWMEKGLQGNVVLC